MSTFPIRGRLSRGLHSALALTYSKLFLGRAVFCSCPGSLLCYLLFPHLLFLSPSSFLRRPSLLSVEGDLQFCCRLLSLEGDSRSVSVTVGPRGRHYQFLLPPSYPPLAALCYKLATLLSMSEFMTINYSS